MFQAGQGITGINSQVFPASTWKRGHLLCPSTFQTLNYSISKCVQVNPCGFIRDKKKGPLNQCAKFQ